MTKKRINRKGRNKGFIKTLFLYFISPTVVVVFLHLILQTEIKFLYKEIDRREIELEILQSKLETELVEVQKLTTEDRIVEIAKGRLGMVRINNSVENIYLNNLKINQIKRIVDSKYE